ncbi:S8 family serine peptidase [Marinospirillum perlucidum]|uniref:S8 family serine peptidase n=1 Tax=Marinospirillum perlucidum TaxID=1982602 RepID=UPI000DF3CDE0|nr:S8 family serine peptidase [Marinospirillum perlucidum]
MRFLLLVIFLFWSVLATAQGLLVAWEPGQAPAVIQVPATEDQSTYQLAGERQRTAPSVDYELYLYEVEDRIQYLQLFRQLRADQRVRFVEKNARVEIQAGLSPPEHFVALGLVDASDQLIQYPCDQFPIAIVDTGVDLDHPALTNGVTLDYQKNYLDESSLPDDDHGHGTHIAGLIAAEPAELTNKDTNEKQSIAGVCSTAVLHVQKTLDSVSRGRLSDVNAALLDALESHGSTDGPRFPIINTSLVASGGRSTLEGVLGDLSDRGQFVIAAAGNNGQLIDIYPKYPAAFSNDLPLVISVGNSTSSNQLHSTSNYGYQQVDLAAPGELLFSSWKEGEYRLSTGTSMATPLVAATLAALMQKYSTDTSLTSEAYRAALLNSLSLNRTDLEGKLRYPGVLNTRTALTADKTDLFKPTWFNFDWIDGADALYLKGYELSQVDSLVFRKEGASSTETVAFEYEATEDRLRVTLPSNWQEGRLEIQAGSQDLEPLDFTLMVQDSLPEDVTLCEAETCRIAWGAYNVDVTRRDGNADTTWWLSTRDEGSDELLVITGVDLSANWEFYFSGHPRLRLVGMEAKQASQGYRLLTSTEGYTAGSQGYSGSWVVDQPGDWSTLEPPFQQLVLRPDVRLASSSSSRVECYIATQVYGDAYAPQVQSLRDFRDEVLMSFSAGRWLVEQYYTYSPDIAEWMADKPRLEAGVRWVLDAWVSLWEKIS